MKKIRNILCCGMVLGAMYSPGAFAQSSTASGQQWLERGMEMYQHENYVGAEDQFEHALQMRLSPKEAEMVNFYLAMSLYHRDCRVGVKYLSNFITTYPNSSYVPHAQATLGDYEFFHGRYVEALHEYNLCKIDGLDNNCHNDVLYRKGFCYLQTAEYRKAQSCFASIAGDSRYSQAVIFYEGYVDYAEGRYSQARQKFARVGTNGELGYHAQYYLCQIHYAEGEYEQAEQMAKTLLGRSSMHESVKAELNRVTGESLCRLGRTDEAYGYMSEYMNTCGGQPLRSASYYMGTLQYGRGEYEQCVKTLQGATQKSDDLAQSAYFYIGQSNRAMKDNRAAAAAFQRAVQLDFTPEVTEMALYNYAVSQAEGPSKSFNESVGAFEDFVNKYPNSKLADQAEEYLVSAYVNSNDYANALKSLNRIKNPSQKLTVAKQNIYYNLGIQQLQKGDVKNAKQNFTEAINLAGGDKRIAAEARLWQGECFYKQGNYTSAEQNQRAYLKAYPNGQNADVANYNLGYSLMMQRKYSDAVPYFTKALTGKNLTTDQKADTHYRLADCHYYCGQYSAAQEQYNKAYSLAPSTGDYAMYQQAMMMGINKQYSAKVAQIDKMLSKYPKSTLAASAQLEKGNAYVALKKNEQAIDAYEQVVSRYPKTQEARKALIQKAITLRDIGKEQASIDAYKQVISRYPSSEEAQVALEDLKLIYADKGRLSELTAFVNSVAGAPRLNVQEVEKLSYDAAEKAVASNSDVAKMQEYLKQYPNGSYAANAHYYVAKDAYDRGDNATALSHIEKALEKHDADFADDALSIKAGILYKQGDYSQALATYSQLADRTTNSDTQIIANIGVMRSAMESKQWSKVESAANHLQSLTGLSAGENREVTFCKAYAAAQQGDTAEAEKLYTTLAKELNDLYGVRGAYELAQLQYSRKDYKQAERTLNRIIDSGTSHNYWLAKGFITLSDVLHAQGRDFEACEYLESLQSNYPGKEADIFQDISTRLSKWGKKKK